MLKNSKFYRIAAGGRGGTTYSTLKTTRYTQFLISGPQFAMNLREF